ncbi:MAG TPA: M56 family metallopeptidase [Tepidisphaeraceae bacterium]|jgi:beta-lactamase regulating signal transducer with metallopeptidase domain
MSALLEFLVENGVMLAGGMSALLLVGVLVAMACRAPLHRQRVCETTVACAMAWALLACVPMPRVGWGDGRRIVPPAARSMPISNAVASGAPLKIAVAEIPPELVAKLSDPPVRPVDWPQAQPSVATRSIDLGRWLSAGWLVVAAACCGWLALGHLLLWRVVGGAMAAPAWVIELAGMKQDADRLCVLVSRRVAGPFTCGLWRAVIVLPASLVATDCRARLRQVLRHEIAHVRQRDRWGNALLCAALPLMYFHPLYWLLRRWCELSRELVADDWAARADGKDAYAQELVALARSGAAGGILVGSMGILRGRSAFYRRMRMLLERTQPLETRCSTWCRGIFATVALAAVVGGAMFAGVGPARAQDATVGEPAKTATDLSPGSKPQVEQVVTGAPGEGESAPSAAGPVETRIEQLRGRLGQAEMALDATKQNKDARAKAIHELTVNQISILDPQMRDLVKERQNLEGELARLRAQGVGDDNPRLQQEKATIDRLAERMEKYAIEWRDLQMKLGDNPGIAPSGFARSMPLSEKALAGEITTLKDQIAQLKAQEDQAFRALRAAGADADVGHGRGQALPPGAGRGAGRGQDSGPALAAAASVGGVQLDLVNLANTMVDASGAVRLASVKYKIASQQGKNGTVTELELESAGEALKTAEKRLALLKSIAGVALDAARTDLVRTQQMFKAGAESDQMIAERESRVRLLELIIKSAE